MASTSPAVLRGYLDPDHTSDLSAYWIHHPTPWPFLLVSVLLSLVLGFIGYQTSSKSWSPKKPKKSKNDNKNKGSFNQAGNDFAPFIQDEVQQSYFPRQKKVGFAEAFATLPSEIWFNFTADPEAQRQRRREREALAEVRLHEQWRAEGRVVTESDDNTIHAGFGKFALTRTAIGLIWTTLRTVTLFVLLVKIMLGSGDAFPGVISIVVLFASAQAYLGSRAMPRIAYLFIFLDLLIIYGCIAMSVYGLWQSRSGYEVFGVSGGACPCLLGTQQLGFVSCAVNATSFSSDHGCSSTDYLWSNNDDFFPKACSGSTFGTDNQLSDNPNHDATWLWDAEVVVGGGGLLYGLAVLFYGLLWVQKALHKPSLLMKPLSFWDRSKMIKPVRVSSSFALCAIFALTVLTLTVHILDETRPINLFYEDSGTDWSDCFEVTVPISKNGFFAEWWNMTQSRALRALAGI